jgi:hypothetical protein
MERGRHAVRWKLVRGISIRSVRRSILAVLLLLQVDEDLLTLEKRRPDAHQFPTTQLAVRLLGQETDSVLVTYELS